MPYKYLNASSIIQYDPKTEFINDFQNMLDEEFSVASDVYTIQEEYPFGSGTYRNIQVRVNTAITAPTGDKLGDDFKQILFQDITHPTERGWMYQFDNNYWITISTEKIKNLAASVIVRRCNNLLRWMDSNGINYRVPCIIENTAIRENRNYATAGSAILMLSGFIDVITQLTPTTNTIRPNQRFLIGNPGNWTAYKVLGAGINNFNNVSTADLDSMGTLKLSLEASYVNAQTDDLVNGVADVLQNGYTVTILPNNMGGNIAGNVGGTYQLIAQVKMNDEIVSKPVTWSSSDTSIATVNASTGVVTFVATGDCVLSCALLNNGSITDSIDCNVSLSPLTNYEVKISPEDNFILEGQEVTYTVALWLNGIEQIDGFVFDLDANGVPSASYTFTRADNKHFKVKNNIKYLNAPLKVSCTSGTVSRIFEIYLRGAW